MGTQVPHLQSRIANVHAAMRGDRLAFTRLVEEFSSTVCAITLAVMGDKAQSVDVAQDVFLSAWRGLARLRDPANFGPWLLGAARRHALFCRRSRSRWKARFFSNAQLVATERDTALGADAKIAALENSRFMSEVIAALPRHAREVLILYYWEEQSLPRVATLLGISTEAAKKRLARARASIKASWLERFGEAAKLVAPTTAFIAVLTRRLSEASAANVPLVQAMASTKVATVVTFAATAIATALFFFSWPRTPPSILRGVTTAVETALDRNESPASFIPHGNNESITSQTTAALLAHPRLHHFLLPQPTTAAFAAQAPTLPDTLSRDDVLAVIQNNLHTALKCLGEHVADSSTDREALREIKMAWVVEPSGRATEAQLLNEVLKGGSLEQCIVQAIEKWRFPTYREGKIPVTFPVRFSGATGDEILKTNELRVKRFLKTIWESPDSPLAPGAPGSRQQF